MKRLVSLMCVFLILVSLAACGKDGATPGFSEAGTPPDESSSKAYETAEGTVSVFEDPLVQSVMNQAENPESDFSISDFSDGTSHVYEYIGDGDIVVVPSKLKGGDTTSLAAFSFQRKDVKAVRLADSVEEIDLSAFSFCDKLEVFVAGSGLKEIGIGAFQECPNLRIVILNDGLETIEYGAFSNNTSLLRIEIPESVTKIDEDVFEGASSDLVIVGKAGSVAETYAKENRIIFENLEGVKTYPEEIDESGLISVEDLMNHEESPEEDFVCVDHGDGVVELVEYTGTDEVIVIPEYWKGKQITTISPYSFGYNSIVKAVRVPDSVTEISDFVFGTNERLEVVILGSGVKSLGQASFMSCTNLRELVIKDGLEKIDTLAISGCESLKRLYVPGSVSEIGINAISAVPEDFVMVGSAGSVAESYAKENGITFEIG